MILGIAAGVLSVVGLVRQASSMWTIVLILLCAAAMAKGGWV